MESLITKIISGRSEKIIFIICYLLFAVSAGAQNRLDVIVLDAGHGGKDPGTIGDNTGVQEKNIVLPITIRLGELIQNRYPSIQIVYTRTADDFIELKDRTKIANDANGKLFISIHANHKKMDETEKNGFEIYLLSRERYTEAVNITLKENKTLLYSLSGGDTVDTYIFSALAQAGYNRFNEYLASNIEVNFLNFTQLASRGAMQAGFWVIVGASMPAVLVETGYVSDINDEKYLSGEKGQTDIAFALFNAFQNYKIIYESQ